MAEKQRRKKEKKRRRAGFHPRRSFIPGFPVTPPTSKSWASALGTRSSHVMQSPFQSVPSGWGLWTTMRRVGHPGDLPMPYCACALDPLLPKDGKVSTGLVPHRRGHRPANPTPPSDCAHPPAREDDAVRLPPCPCRHPPSTLGLQFAPW